MDNVILFGAGASYGSSRLEYDGYQPHVFLYDYNASDFSSPTNDLDILPLGNNLYSKLKEFDTVLWDTFEDFFDGKRFEEGWGQLRNHFDDNYLALSKYTISMSKYFYQFLPAATSNYFYLATHLRKMINHGYGYWKGAIITLNYENLLTHSLLHNKVPVYYDYFMWEKKKKIK